MNNKLKLIKYVSHVIKSHDTGYPLAHTVLGTKYIPVGVAGTFRKAL